MTNSVTTQAEFVKVDDDGAANGGTLGTADANWTQDTDTPIRIRFRLTTTGKDETDGYTLYQNYNGGGYVAVTTSSTEVKAVASGYAPPPTDGAATTERMAGPATFTAGQWVDDGIVDSMTIAVGEETELEFCIELVGADLVDANTILFEVHFDNTTGLDGYTVRPTLTVNIPAGAENFQTVAGTLTSSGSLTKQTNKTLAGILTSSGILAAIKAAASIVPILAWRNRLARMVNLRR